MLAKAWDASSEVGTKKSGVMKYRITKYQVIYENGARDTIKLKAPIYTDDYEAERAKLKSRHSGHGKKAIGVNLDYEELN